MLHVHTLQEAEERLVTYQDSDPDGDCSTCDEMMALPECWTSCSVSAPLSRTSGP